MEDLKPYRILHFAAHGIMNNENPLRSAIILAKAEGEVNEQLRKKGLNPMVCNDGILQTRDIFLLHKRINADLVVLSACETGLAGQIVSGDGMNTLARAWQFAGTSSVVASLWKVDDGSSSQCMVKFYQYLLSDKGKQVKNIDKRRRIALHKAKQYLRKTEKYNAPYYWAPFVLIGND